MTLHAPYDPDNIFAKILREDVPSVKVWEDEHVLAFMDVFPQSEGHVLVISKTSSARTLLDVEPEVLAHLAAATQRTARAIVKALRPEGFQIMQFNGESGGQTVYHLHFHIIPRWEGVAMGRHASGGMADPAELKVVAEQIAAKIA